MATIRKRNGKYQVQVRRLGHRPVTRTFVNQADALKWARMTETQADQRDLPPDTKVLKRTTLANLIDRYLASVSVRKKSLRNEQWFLNPIKRHSIGSLSLAEVTPQEIVKYRDFRLQPITTKRGTRTVKAVSVNRELQILRHLFNVARKEWGLPIDNPVTGLLIPGADKPRDVRLLPDAEAKLMAALRGENQIVTAVVMFALETGMRRGEVLNVRKSHILWQEPALLIPESKSGHARTIVLTKTAALVLSLRSEQTDDVEGEDARLFPVTIYELRGAFRRARKKAGLPSLRFHDLRHERASRFFEDGLTVPEAALMLGHRTYQMLTRYTHPQRAVIAEKLDQKPALRLVHHHKA